MKRWALLALFLGCAAAWPADAGDSASAARRSIPGLPQLPEGVKRTRGLPGEWHGWALRMNRAEAVTRARLHDCYAVEQTKGGVLRFHEDKSLRTTVLKIYCGDPKCVEEAPASGPAKVCPPRSFPFQALHLDFLGDDLISATVQYPPGDPTLKKLTASLGMASVAVNGLHIWMDDNPYRFLMIHSATQEMATTLDLEYLRAGGHLSGSDVDRFIATLKRIAASPPDKSGVMGR
ncbi:MAG: hypothetical protein GMKNLPBB_01880 [Myxococcota bacterium]|nr:hypothetical protein [Myxococcota bacterium]